MTCGFCNAATLMQFPNGGCQRCKDIVVERVAKVVRVRKIKAQKSAKIKHPPLSTEEKRMRRNELSRKWYAAHPPSKKRKEQKAAAIKRWINDPANRKKANARQKKYTATHRVAISDRRRAAYQAREELS